MIGRPRTARTEFCLAAIPTCYLHSRKSFDLWDKNSADFRLPDPASSLTDWILRPGRPLSTAKTVAMIGRPCQDWVLPCGNFLCINGNFIKY